MSDNRPRILISGRCDKLVKELYCDEGLNEFVIDYIPDIKHVIGMLGQVSAAYRLALLSSDTDDTDQLISGMAPFVQSQRSFLLVSLSKEYKEDLPRLLDNPAILSLMPKPLNPWIVGKFFRVFGFGGPWNRLNE